MTIAKKAAAQVLLNTSVADIAGVHPRKGDIWGMELENELDEDHNPLPMNLINNVGFKVQRDGSLRGAGYEFISGATNLNKLKENVSDLCGLVKDFPWSFSRRTSTHVHLNMSDRTTPELLKFLALYWMMEPIILFSLKPSRIGNTFCATTNTTRDMIVTSINQKYTLPVMKDEDQTKYASLNLTTLFKLGSAECRLFHASFDDQEIHRWLDSLDGILQASKKVVNLQDLKDKFIQKEPLEFIQGVWGRKLTEYYRGLGPIDDALREGFRAARPVLRTGKTLTELENFLLEEERLQQKRLEAARQALTRDVDILTYLAEAPDLRKLAEPVVVAPPAQFAPPDPNVWVPFDNPPRFVEVIVNHPEMRWRAAVGRPVENVVFNEEDEN